MPIPLLVPILASAGLGALIEGIVSAVTATGSASPEDIEKAKAGFMEVGMSEEAAQRMAEDVASEVSGGDRAAAAATGALTGGLTGAVGGAAIGGAAKLGGALLKSKAGTSAMGKLKSFIGRDAPSVEAPMPAASPALSAPSVPVGTGGSVRRGGMASGEAESVAAQRLGRPAEMRQEILGELEKRPGELAYRKQLATKDDGLQGLIDDVMPKRDAGPIPEFMPGEMVSKTPSASLRPWESMPEVIGAQIRKEGATSFLGGLEGTPAAATIVPNVMRAAGKRAAVERGAAFQSRAEVNAAIRQAQIDGEFEKAQLLAKLFG